eukprot:767839-Rhodomonas_salina.2
MAVCTGEMADCHCFRRAGDHIFAIDGASIQVAFPIGLRRCSAMSGTDVAYAATCLRRCYAMSGTDMAYGVRY